MARVCLYCARFQNEEFGVEPLGLGYLVSYLIHQGIVAEGDIRVVDTIEDAIAFQPDVLGVSAVSQVLADARNFALRCKEATGCLTVLGGYHVTCVPHRLPAEFDVVVLGEGEVTFAEVGNLDTAPADTYRDQLTLLVVPN